MHTISTPSTKGSGAIECISLRCNEIWGCFLVPEVVSRAHVLIPHLGGSKGLLPNSFYSLRIWKSREKVKKKFYIWVVKHHVNPGERGRVPGSPGPTQLSYLHQPVARQPACKWDWGNLDAFKKREALFIVENVICYGEEACQLVWVSTIFSRSLKDLPSLEPSAFPVKSPRENLENLLFVFLGPWHYRHSSKAPLWFFQ